MPDGAHPVHPPGRNGPGAVRAAAPADAEAVAAVAARSWRATYTGLLPPERIKRAVTDGYAPARLRGQIAACEEAAPERVFLVAERDGAVAGFLHLGPNDANEPELHRLYVDPDRFEEGIGGALLDALHARLGPQAEYTLRVHPGNVRAREFYRRRGLVEDGRAGGECDIRMRFAPARAAAA